MGQTGHAGLYVPFSPLFNLRCQTFCSHWVHHSVLAPFQFQVPLPKGTTEAALRSRSKLPINEDVSVPES